MKNLKKLRLERGLTQKQLADALGIDRTAVAKYETGKNGATSEMLEKIADYFAVSSDYVLGRDQEINYALLDGGEHFRIDDATHREIMEFAGYAKEQKKAPSKDEAELVELTELFGKLTPENRTILLAAAKGLAQDK
jgi:transcriptional regulator with XRE-family HTH domain